MKFNFVLELVFYFDYCGICYFHKVMDLHLDLGCLEYETELHLVVRLQFWSCGECWLTPTLLSLPGPLWSGVVASLRVPCMGQMDLLEEDGGQMFGNILVCASLWSKAVQALEGTHCNWCTDILCFASLHVRFERHTDECAI